MRINKRGKKSAKSIGHMQWVPLSLLSFNYQNGSRFITTLHHKHLKIHCSPRVTNPIAHSPLILTNKNTLFIYFLLLLFLHFFKGNLAQIFLKGRAHFADDIGVCSNLESRLRKMFLKSECEWGIVAKQF